MNPWTLGEAARCLGGECAGDATQVLGRWRVDSREVKPGDFFICLPGARVDGHGFVKQAADRGARAALVSGADNGPTDFPRIKVADTLLGLGCLAEEQRRRWGGRLIGVTGSNGKTTTKDMVAAVLRAGGKSVLVTPGNLNSQIGLPLVLQDLSDRYSHAVLEMGASQRGDIRGLARLAQPQVGVITNIGRAHLASFGTPENVAEAKWELIEALPSEGSAVINREDVALWSRRRRAPCRVVSFGIGVEADVRAENVLEGERVSFDLVSRKGAYRVTLPLAGIFNVRNALVAAAVGELEGVGPALMEGLKQFTPPAQRMEVLPGYCGSVLIFDAYNSNPSSMDASLEAFCRAYPGKEKMVVLGRMLELGTYAEGDHGALGRALAGLPLQRAVFVGRPEGDWVAQGFSFLGGQFPLDLVDTPAQAAQLLRPHLGPSKVVLFKASRSVHLEEACDLLKP